MALDLWLRVAIGLALTAATSLSWAPPVGRPAAPHVAAKPITKATPTTTTTIGGHESGKSGDSSEVEYLRDHGNYDSRWNWPQSTYDANLAIELFQSGLVAVEMAKVLGYDRKLQYSAAAFAFDHQRRPKGNEWKPLIDQAIARLEAKVEAAKEYEQREQDQRDKDLRDRLSAEEQRAAPLNAAVVAALQSSTMNRRAVVDPNVPEVVVKLADESAFDRAIIDHTWFRHATALNTPMGPDKLHLVNLFPDPLGNALVRKIQQQLGSKTTSKDAALSQLQRILTGKAAFSHASLVLALSPIQGETVYIVSHIPEASAGHGHLEFPAKDGAVATSIARLQSAFKEAKVNLFIVGCASALHTHTGLSKEIFNTDALEGFLNALNEPTPRSLFSWHAAFAAGARVVVDPVATEVFDQNVPQGAISKVALEKNGRAVSTGYVGTFASPPPSSNAGPPSIPLAVASGSMTVPSDASMCAGAPTPMQSAVATRLAPWANICLLLGLLIAIDTMRKLEDPSKPAAPRTSLKLRVEEALEAVLGGLMLSLPIAVCLYSWGMFDSGPLKPGPFLPAWCWLYGALTAWAWADSGSRRLDRLSVVATLLLVASALFGWSYLGWGADQALQNFCAAVSKA